MYLCQKFKMLARIAASFYLLAETQIVFAQSGVTEKEAAGPGNVFSVIIGKLPLWITAVIIFAVSLVAGVIIKGVVESRLASKVGNEHQEVTIVSGRIAFVIIAIIGTSLALAVAGINITTLLAAVGFGISFGLQDTIANFVAGIALLASRPFTIGDWIKVNGKTGKVVEIRTRATYLKTYDGLRLIVPNAQLYKSEVLSFTSNTMRRIKVPVYCRYGADIQKIIEICLDLVKQNNKIFLEPKPSIVVLDLESSYITLQLRFWVDSKSAWRKAQSDIFIGIESKLEALGMEAPYAITSLSLEPEFAAALNERKFGTNELQGEANEKKDDISRIDTDVANKTVEKPEYTIQAGDSDLTQEKKIETATQPGT